MSQLRRQRLKKLLLINKTTTSKANMYLTTIIIILITTILMIQRRAEAAQQQEATPFQFIGSQLSIPKQYQASSQSRSSPITNSLVISNNNNINNLISRPQQYYEQAAQSLPLIKQQQQQLDLDNVIESTTPNLLLGQQFAQNNNHHQAPTTNSRCQLPATWAGKWFQSNKEPIRITNTEISDKGICRDQKGDKYLFEYNNNNSNKQQSCYYCLVINERHLNVLQYKESNCQSNVTNQSINNLMNSAISNVDSNYIDHSLLDSICSEINGDATLESLFRLDAPAIECPISGQFSFTYDGCREPQSAIDSCIDKKQLNFKFSACQDVPGSESKSEVLKCYADWSEGNNYYMIGRLEHASNHQDKGKFRCFVYDKSSDGKYIQMAQTQEENCYGLLGPNEGPRILRLTAKPPTTYKCHFPSYIQSLSENWLSVDNSLIYVFNQNSTKYQVKETKEGNIIEEAACLQQFSHPQQIPSSNSQQPHSLHQQHTRSNIPQQQQILSSQNRRSSQASNLVYTQADQSSSYQTQIPTPKATINDVYLVQITKNCQTTNYCVRFYRRSNGIVQIDYFLSPTNGDNQCRVAYFGTPQTQIITSTNIEHQRCPFEGAYTIDAPIESDLTYNPSNIFICPRQSYLLAQCDHPSRLRIHSRCSPSRFLIKNLYCLGSWTTGGLVRLLLADDERQRYSAWYKDSGSMQVSSQDATQTGDIQQPEALQQVLTRSQQMLNLATSMTTTNAPIQQTSNNLVNLFSPTVDLRIALITPLPFAVKTMQVRLTRRHQCSDLRFNSNFASTANGVSSSSSSTSSSMLSYSSSPSSAISSKTINYYSSSSILILIVTTFISNFLSQQHRQQLLATTIDRHF